MSTRMGFILKKNISIHKIISLGFKDVFNPIIEKGQKIPVDKNNSKNYTIKGSKSKIFFNKTSFYNIPFVDENYNLVKLECQKFGELTLDVCKKFDKNNRDLIIQLKLEGTFISDGIIYKNEIMKANLDLAKENQINNNIL